MKKYILEIKEEMTSDEIVSMTRGSGADLIYLCGDEPIDRSNIEGEVAAITEFAEVKLETSGLALDQIAGDLKESGLKQVVVKIDTMKHSKFKEPHGRSLDYVFSGINAAERAEITPVRLKTTISRGFNDEEILDYLQLTFQHNYEILYVPGDGITKEDILKKMPAYRKSDDDSYDVEWGKYPGATGKICFEK